MPITPNHSPTCLKETEIPNDELITEIYTGKPSGMYDSYYSNRNQETILHLSKKSPEKHKVSWLQTLQMELRILE